MALELKGEILQHFLAMTEVLAVFCASVWIYLLAVHGRFWLASIRDSGAPTPPTRWPPVAAVIPARNEAEVIGASLQSLLRQNYPGPLNITVVDDESSDGTAAIAGRAAAGADRSLTVLKGRAPPSGWTGKLWAIEQGVAAAEQSRPDYLLLTDADIVHAPDTVAWLVAQAETGSYVLTSLMAKLRCESFAEQSTIPAFVYFFQMLFPFAWVSRADCGTAAAAGGCMLVRADALASVGGIGGIRNALIDDCALASRLKTVGQIWLGLTDRVRSIRPYRTLADVRHMVSRSAYAQLRYSPLRLVAAAAGLMLTFLLPPLLAIFCSGWVQYLGFAVWLAMTISFVPILQFYRLSPLWGFALPAVAMLYMSYTLHSAYRHWRGRGGEWKGRVHVDAPGLP